MANLQNFELTLIHVFNLKARKVIKYVCIIFGQLNKLLQIANLVNLNVILVDSRDAGGGGRGRGRGCMCPPPQVLGYQLTLFRPRGADYAQHITTGPPSFWTMRRLCWFNFRRTGVHSYAVADELIHRFIL